MREKAERLKEYIASFGSVCVAFSGGADSAFLLKTAKDVLGDNAFAVTVCSPALADEERAFAKLFCKKWEIRHEEIYVDMLSVPEVRQNPKNRCYFCKKEIFSKLIRRADALGAKAIFEGSNTDDEGDFRPGMRAVYEMGVKSPLKDCGISKAEIREMSKKMGLETWDKPSSACLMSRIAYTEEITKEKLIMISKAERILKDMGFSNIRARLHGDLFRIEADKNEISRLALKKDDIVSQLKQLGAKYICLDLEGFRSGSMNEVLK